MAGNHFYEEIIIAGFGGQGILLAAKLLAQTAMKAEKEVTYMPSYGAEVRGGTANCCVIISEEAIACPVVGRPDSLIVMNKASLHKFYPLLQSSGLLIYNSSLIDEQPEPLNSVEILPVPANEIAVELGNVKAANMVAIGAFLGKKGLFGTDAAAESLPEVLAERYHKTIPLNTKALHKGSEFTEHYFENSKVNAPYTKS